MLDRCGVNELASERPPSQEQTVAASHATCTPRGPQSPYPHHAIRAVPPADPVQTLHEADKAIQELPLLLICPGPVPIDVAVGLPLRDALGGSDTGW